MDNLHKPTSCAALSYFRVPSLALRAIHLVPRLRRVADLCSSTVSEMRICGYNAEEKILCRTPFPAYAVYHLHPSPRRKGRSLKRKGNHGCPFLFAPAASAAVPAQKWRTVYTVRAHRKAGACDRFAILENALCLSHSACYN